MFASMEAWPQLLDGCGDVYSHVTTAYRQLTKPGQSLSILQFSYGVDLNEPPSYRSDKNLALIQSCMSLQSVFLDGTEL